MMGYISARFHTDPEAQSIVKRLVLDVIDMFGPARCMFASNYPVDHDQSLGRTAKVLYPLYRSWVAHLSEDAQQDLFHNTAARFYRLHGSSTVPVTLSTSPKRRISAANSDGG